ncbi:MAG: 4Fe-4S dicluster domain-containing protein [Chloroflexi bacterium]|nr:4Fe-4S dicluster domain-containing protein [Chloroflexota bacterium]
MPHIITSLCLRDGACLDVCPSEAIVPGFPIAEWPWYFIDQDSCIDCGACVTECPLEAIFEEDEVPDAYEMSAGQGRAIFGQITVENGELVPTKYEGGEVVDLTPDIQVNYDFFEKGPGHDAAP